MGKMKDDPSAVTIRRLRKTDCNEAGKFSAKMMDWMYEKYEKGNYPKEASEFDKQSYSAAKIGGMFNHPDFFGYVAEKNGRICGLVLANVYGRSGFGFINWLAVDPRNQHEGIGIRLMMATEEQMKRMKCHKISLNTLPCLLPAVKLYMKFGLLPEAYLRQQWWGADFIVMSKWIGKYKKH